MQAAEDAAIGRQARGVGEIRPQRPQHRARRPQRSQPLRPAAAFGQRGIAGLVRPPQIAMAAEAGRLGRALALRHRETAQHSDRLTSDCTAVGRALGVAGDELRDLTFAAALHDLGKIGVPEQVLGNSGPLDDEGWRLIHGHPELGAQIIDPVGALAGAAVLIRACHEHWDGTGYPRGLTGDEIPLGSRVILACDAYHAMCEERSYQPAMPPAEARGRVRDLAGVDFDPRVVEALLLHLDRTDRSVTQA